MMMTHGRSALLLLLATTTLLLIVSGSSWLQQQWDVRPLSRRRRHRRRDFPSTSFLAATRRGDNHGPEDASPVSRRSILHQTLAALVIPGGTLFCPATSHAAAAAATASSSSSGSGGVMSSSSQPSWISPEEATVTRKVFMDVRISRQDGTFYVRDDLPDTPENRVYTGRLVIGLYGKNAPVHVERFLSYIVVPSDNPLEEDPLPNYGRSLFTSFDQATGLLLGGKIPSLEVTDIGGNAAIRYGGRLLPATLWLEKGDSSTAAAAPARISHSAKGLLTHRILDATPVFGITTRSDTTVLDRTHVVFGKILLDESSRDFLQICQNLPTYSTERPTVTSDSSSLDTSRSTVVDEAAQAVYTAQRDFFRKAAQTLGDTRLDKVYSGKLLRRVEVTRVGVL